MEEVISFKTRVKNVAINEAKLYESVFVNYEYLICSKAFEKQKFYTINAKEENYMHLIGVNSSLSAIDFFNKCSDGILNEDDFNFIKRRQSEGSVKGSVRRKISVLHNIMEMFLGKIDIWAEENFEKNDVICNLATSDQKCTIGFANTSKAYPKTLQKGNELNENKMKKVDLILRKKNDEEKFNEIIIGNINNVMKYFDDIKDLIDDSLITSSKSEIQKEIALTSIKKLNSFK
ncbi:PBECR4 domain-containing protein [Clostridium perfringens]|uniref:PBECR4 domain-containing protein n=1 Tax=Clostridium perfringens TaxID=1502 RepID=UPI001094490C|nr:PBECR4 domain-containing protein [Clostridium perfringens]MDK0710405.1 PBECR4 domain-containing protein [Clostridium perfringens]MDK0713376.1 PBECR4 domain-containing protein [Clostridium perfringens]TGY45074.1 hypothetical protein E5346_10185 [Clostridium perfringens]